MTNKLEIEALETDSIAFQKGPRRSEVVEAAGEVFCREKGFRRSVRAIFARIARNDCLEKRHLHLQLQLFSFFAASVCQNRHESKVLLSKSSSV